MKPEVDQILMITAGQIMAELAPNLTTHYTQGAAQLAAIMAILSAQEYDRAAEIRVAENCDLRALFAELGPVVADPGLRTRLEEAASGEDASLRIAPLDQTNYALRELLIQMHEVLETQGDAAGQTKVWSLLKRLAERRQLHLPPS